MPEMREENMPKASNTDLIDAGADWLNLTRQRLARLRFEGWLWEELANAIGCHPRTLRKVREGQDLIATDAAERIAEQAEALQDVDPKHPAPFDRAKVQSDGEALLAWFHTYVPRTRDKQTLEEVIGA